MKAGGGGGMVRNTGQIRPLGPKPGLSTSGETGVPRTPFQEACDIRLSICVWFFLGKQFIRFLKKVGKGLRITVPYNMYKLPVK